MGRMYTAQFNNISIAAAQDVWELLPASAKPIIPHRVVITPYDSETNEQLTVTLQTRTGAPTSGSGGGTVTAEPVGHTVAAGTTVERNNTTRASAGTQHIIHSESFPSQGGFDWRPTPEERDDFLVQNAALLIVGLETAPGASTAFNSTIWFEELG